MAKFDADLLKRTAYTSGLMRGALAVIISDLEVQEINDAATYARAVADRVDRIMAGEEAPEDPHPRQDER